jgi:hypothetical protein
VIPTIHESVELEVQYIDDLFDLTKVALPAHGEKTQKKKQKTTNLARKETGNRKTENLQPMRYDLAKSKAFFPSIIILFFWFYVSCCQRPFALEKRDLSGGVSKSQGKGSKGKSRGAKSRALVDFSRFFILFPLWPRRQRVGVRGRRRAGTTEGAGRPKAEEKREAVAQPTVEQQRTRWDVTMMSTPDIRQEIALIKRNGAHQM